jgi:hypothetical protein
VDQCSCLEQSSADDGACLLLNDVVAAGGGHDVLVVNVSPARDLLDRGSVAAELVGMNDLWDIIFNQESGQKRLRHFGIPVPLKEKDELEAVLVHRTPAGRRRARRPFCPRHSRRVSWFT